jgi:hypothetical protein
METEQIKQLWVSNEKTVFRLMKDFWTSYPKIEWDDYYGGGLDCFLRCIERYSKEQNNGACFNTYLHVSIQGFFKGMIQKHIAISQLKVDEHPSFTSSHLNSTNDDYSDFNCKNDHIDRCRRQAGASPTERLNILKDHLSKMSEDAVDVVNAIFALGLRTKGEIRKYLLSKWHGEGIQNRISGTFQEIKTTLKAIEY